MRDISDSFLSSQLMLLCIFSVVTVHVATVAFFLQSHMALGFEPLVGKRCFSIASQEQRMEAKKCSTKVQFTYWL